MNSNRISIRPNIRVRRLEKPPYIIDHSELRRFHEKDRVFERVMWDPSWKGYKRRYDEKVPEIIKKERLGRSRIDFALAYASWIVHDAFRGGFARRRIKPYRVPVDTFGVDLTETKLRVEDPKE